MVAIRHTGIVTQNLKKSLFFWKKIIGFKLYKLDVESSSHLDEIFGYKNVKVKTIKLKDNKQNKIELLYFYNAPKIKKDLIKPYNIGITHISITVENIKKLQKILIKNKVKFNAPPKKSADGKVLMTYCRTPEGYYLELVQIL